MRDDDGQHETHPWLEIDLGVYEQHMSDPRVGQLQRLREITAEQIYAHPTRSLGILGVAGGNGLDLREPTSVDNVYGYDINPDYLAACEKRYRPALGSRLHLVEARIDRTLMIASTGLLIANLLVEYVGIDEFSAFVGANISSIGTLSCVIQRNDATGFVSCTPHASSFDGLGTVASDIDADELTTAMSEANLDIAARHHYPLPNGKLLIRMDFQSRT